LEENQDKLFTFLKFDGVPWNNNAEHAIKALARLRRIVTGRSSPKGIEDYLILLSICQTRKYMGMDFLDFLRSGEKDLHAFAESRRGRGAGPPSANRKRCQRMRRRRNEPPCVGCGGERVAGGFQKNRFTILNGEATSGVATSAASKTNLRRA